MIANKQVNQDGTYLTNRVYNPTVRFPSHKKTSLLKPLQTPKLNVSHIKLPQTICPLCQIYNTTEICCIQPPILCFYHTL